MQGLDHELSDGGASLEPGFFLRRRRRRLFPDPDAAESFEPWSVAPPESEAGLASEDFLLRLRRRFFLAGGSPISAGPPSESPAADLASSACDAAR